MENINEHDKTKEMMNILRGGFAKKLMTEGVDDNDTEVELDANSGPYKEQLEGLRIIIETNTIITKFTCYPNKNNLIMEGICLNDKGTDSGVHFQMTFSPKELKSTVKNLDISNETIGKAVEKIVKMLPEYFENWYEKQAPEYISDVLKNFRK